MDAFLLYVDDWLGSTRIALMTAAEERGYLRLLMHSAKQDDCGLPNDPALLAKLSLLGASWKNGSGNRVLACFYQKDGRIYNRRLVEVFHNHLERKERRQKAAEKRWRSDSKVTSACPSAATPKNGDSTCNAGELNDMPMPIPIPIPTLNLNTENLLPVDAAKPKSETAFFDREHERWYRTAYWCRTNRKASRKAFETRVGALVKQRGESPGRCIELLHKWAADDKARWENTPDWDWRSHLHPATWLNGERWEDEPPSTRPVHEIPETTVPQELLDLREASLREGPR